MTVYIVIVTLGISYSNGPKCKEMALEAVDP